MNSFKRAINYYETDAMGVVHHSNYIRFFEEARGFFLDELGIPYSIIEKKGYFIPVLGVECKYIYPAKFGDEITVDVNMKEFKGARMTIEYKIINEDKIIAIGETVHCFTDQNMKPVNIKKIEPDIYEKFNN